MRFIFSILLLLMSAGPLVAQNAGNGVVRLFQYPAANDPSSEGDNVVIDSLTLGYGYRIIEDLPYMAFALEWAAAPAIEDSIWIESIGLTADVIAGNRPSARFYIEADSLHLAPYPDLATLEFAQVDWDDLFEEASGEEARSFFDEGFVLENLRIDFIRLFPGQGEQELVADERPARTGRVVRSGGGIFVDIPIYREPRVRPRAGRDTGRADEPRGEQVGRGNTRGEGDRADDEEGESRTSTKRKDGDDEDEEEDDEMLPAALAGVAAIAAVAVAGGTIGYYGNTKNAPIGLTAGFVRKKGGMLLQIAVNEAVLNRSDVFAERGLGRIVGFYDVFDAPIRPAVGIGVLATEMAGDIDYDLSLSAGIVAPLGAFVLLGGVDLVSGGADISVAYNFRHRR